MNVPLTTQNLAFLVERYSNDVAAFAIDICGFERLDEWQIHFLKSVTDQSKKKIAVKSCHGSGKTLLSSVVALHRLLCYAEARVTITSATEAQLKSAFVTTIQSVIEDSLITDWFNVSAEQITLKGVKGSWIKLRAWSKSKPESIAGVHCISPMFITDECSGIDDAVFEAIEGSMQHQHSCLLMLGNPIHRRGRLFDAFNTKRDIFTTYSVAAEDSSFIPQSWIDDMKMEYGEDSNIYKVRVKGEFPDDDIDAFIPVTLIKAAVDRVVHVDKMEDVVAGMDVGKFHDASVLVIRKGSKVLDIKKYRTRDLMTLSEMVGADIIKYNIIKVAVDANGIGSGVADRLRQMHPGKVFDVKLGNLSPDLDKTYYNGRAKAWGLAKKWLNYGSIPSNKELIEEGSSLLYGYDIHGRFQLERKVDAFKRGVHSPDHFDAFAYSFMVPVDQAGFNNTIEDNYVDIAW